MLQRWREACLCVRVFRCSKTQLKKMCTIFSRIYTYFHFPTVIPNFIIGIKYGYDFEVSVHNLRHMIATIFVAKERNFAQRRLGYAAASKGAGSATAALTILCAPMLIGINMGAQNNFLLKIFSFFNIHMALRLKALENMRRPGSRALCLGPSCNKTVSSFPFIYILPTLNLEGLGTGFRLACILYGIGVHTRI